MSNRVVVIGGGVIGWCTAYYAAEAGFVVTVIDREAPDHARASVGNSGLIVPSHVVPLAAPGMVRLGLKLMRSRSGPFGFSFGADPALWNWAWRFMRSCKQDHVARCAPVLADLHLSSKLLYGDFTKRLIGFEVKKLGLLSVCRDAQTFDHERQTAELAANFGINSEAIVGGEELAAVDPSLNPKLAGAVWFKDDAHIDPGDFLRGLREECLRLGAVAVDHETVTKMETCGSRIAALTISSGTRFEVDHLVLAAGAWSRALGAQLDLNLPVIGGKGHSLNIVSPPVMPQVPMILVEARAAITPLGDSLRIGGTMELGPPNPSVNEARVQGIRNSVLEFLPHLRADQLVNAPVWAGLRPVTPDGMPLLGRPKSVSNLIVATGHAMMGQSLGPITGLLVSELLQGNPPSIALDLMAPDRFN